MCLVLIGIILNFIGDLLTWKSVTLDGNKDVFWWKARRILFKKCQDFSCVLYSMGNIFKLIWSSYINLRFINKVRRK